MRCRGSTFLNNNQEEKRFYFISFHFFWLKSMQARDSFLGNAHDVDENGRQRKNVFLLFRLVMGAKQGDRHFSREKK
jgi:hypothetical protein